MNRNFVSGTEFTDIKNLFSLTPLELSEPPLSGEEYSPWYQDHQRLVLELVKIAEIRKWQTKNDIGDPILNDLYVNFDCFRSRVIYTEVVPELRDDAERAILKLLAKPENQKYCVVVNLQSQPSPNFIEVDQIAHGKIYTLKREADASGPPPKLRAPRG